MSSQLEEIQALKKEIQEIKQKLLEKDSTTKAFGRAYSNVGTSNSDFLIKTKGQVKIQWGNKFIDLIKEGKLNVDAKFIYKQNEVGVKDGIYIVGDDNKVILQVGGTQINLKGEVGTTYVSFQGEQKTSAEEKYTALTNIGFLYKSLDLVDSSSLQNGVIYVESEQKLYTVQNGTLQEFNLKFPNPLTEQLIIQKSDSSKGSLLIVGNGANNSLAFDTMYLYTNSGNTYLDSNGDIYFRISDQEKVRITNDSTVFSNNVISEMFKSNGATEKVGFRLYTVNNESTLEVDNLIVRNQDKATTNIPIIGDYWYYQNNVIVDAAEAQDETRPELLGLSLTLAYKNQFQIGQKLYTYFLNFSEDTGEYSPILLPLNVEALDTEEGSNIVYVSLITDQIDQEIVNSVDYTTVINSIKGQTLFLISSNDSPIFLIRTKENNIDIIETQKLSDATSNDSVISRFGNIEELNLKGRENNQEVAISGSGIYSSNGAFLKAQYTKDYNLPEGDNSTKFASTEWVNKLLPTGTIIMYNGQSIPNGWAICDGTNGTPNLIGKFIKADTVSGQTGGANQVSLVKENLPKVSLGSDSSIGDWDNKQIPIFNNVKMVDITPEGGHNCLVPAETTDITSKIITLKELRNITSKIDYNGDQQPIKIEPEYYSLIYIMKIV